MQGIIDTCVGCGEVDVCVHQLCHHCQEKVAQAKKDVCPIGLDKIHCQNCFWSKEGLCDWPHH